MTRTWPALFAWGAGLLHLAIGAAVTGAPGLGAIAVLTALIALGAAELGWGTAVILAGRPRAPRCAAAAAIAGAALGGGALMVGAPPIAVVAASALAVSAAALVGGSRRRPVRGRRRAPALGLVLGAVIVAGIATPALATTQAGLHAVPHGEHGGFDTGHGEH